MVVIAKFDIVVHVVDLTNIGETYHACNDRYLISVEFYFKFTCSIILK